MGTFSSYQPPPIFPEDTPLDVTGELEVLQSNTRILEELSLLGRDVLQAHAYNNESTNDNPHRYGQWSFEYRTGLTTLTWIGYNTLSATVNEGIRFRAVTDSVGAPTGTVLYAGGLGAGLQTITVSTALASQGWADGQVIEVWVELYDLGAPTPELGTGKAWGRYETIDFYVSPLSAIQTTSWGGVPTFGTSPTSGNLAQLGAAQEWLAQRIALVPRPLFQSIYQGTGLFFLDDFAGDAPIDYQLWAGGLTRGASDRLRLRLSYDIVTNAAETLRLFVNGSLGPSLGPLTAGQRGPWEPTVSLSGYAATDPVRLEVRSRVTTPGAVGRPSRISLNRAQVERASPSPATLPTAPTPEESATWATVKSRLNSLCTIIANARSRIISDAETWDKGRLFRQNYGYDDGAKSYYESRHIAVRLERQGARLVVRGKNVRIGYGAATVKLTNEKEPDGTYELKHAFEETIVPGDGIETRVVYLDGLKGLDVGVPYVLRGDVRYAAEYLL